MLCSDDDHRQQNDIPSRLHNRAEWNHVFLVLDYDLEGHKDQHHREFGNQDDESRSEESIDSVDEIEYGVVTPLPLAQSLADPSIEATVPDIVSDSLNPHRGQSHQSRQQTDHDAFVQLAQDGSDNLHCVLY